MDKSDSSLLRSLAVAFGDGLAFGVGMKLTQKNADAKSAVSAPPGAASRLSRVEQRIDRLERAPATLAAASNADPRVLEALTRALEARVQESVALMDRRLAELDVNLSVELKALREQDRALGSAAETGLAEMHKRLDEQVQTLLRQVNNDRNALQNQVISLHREFAAAVADIVEEQVATQIEERLGALVEQRLAGLVREQLAPLEQQLREELHHAAAAQSREVADLRQRVVESDRNVLDVMLSTGEVFRQAASRLGAPPIQAPAAPEPPPPAEQSAAPAENPQPVPAPTVAAEPAPSPPASDNGTVPYEDADLPAFARSRKAAAGAWSIPLVTSFLVTAGCVAWLQYL